MRIDAKGTVGQYPAFLVRTTLRRLRGRLQWGLPELEAAAGLTSGSGRGLVKALRIEGLIEAVGCGAWTVIQADRLFRRHCGRNGLSGNWPRKERREYPRVPQFPGKSGFPASKSRVCNVRRL